MELPVIHAGRAGAAGKRKDLCVMLYIENRVLQTRREDDYETLKENTGLGTLTARGTPEQNLSPD